MAQQQLTVLIIDDSPEDRALYRRYLLQDQKFFYTILEEETAEGGLELCRQLQPDGILLDFLLPDMDGLEFLAELKRQLNNSLPAVIMLTEQGNVTIAVQAMKSGVQDYLVKGDTTAEYLRFTIHSAIENVRLHQQLQESEERFRTSVENMLDCFGIYSAIRNEAGEIIDFRVDYVNAAACESNQMTKEEQLGKGLCEILPGHRESGLFEEYCQVVETGEPLEKESLIYTDVYGKQQLSRAFNIRVTKLADGFVAAWRDVTAKKQTETALRESEARFKRLVEANMVGVMFWHGDGSISDANDAFLSIVGYSREDLQAGKLNWRALTPPEQLVSSDYSIARMRQNTTDLLEKEYIRKDGSRVPILLGGVMFDGEEDQGVSFVLDLSERQAALRDRQQTEAALQASEAKFRRIVESNIVGIFFGDISGRIYEANDAFLEIVGYTRADLEAGTINWLNLTPPEYATQTERINQQIQATGVCAPIEKEYFRKDGTRVPILLGVARMEGREEDCYSACFVLDLSRRKKAEVALQESEERYRFLSEAIPQLVWICNAKGECEYLNQRWYEFTGQTVEQAMRFGWAETIHPDDVQRVMQVWTQAVNTGEPYQTELRYRCRDGTYHWHLARALPKKDEQGRIVKWFGTSTDIDDSKQLEAERLRLLRVEQEARNEAEAANRAKDEFVAMVSHDLRSPLNAILGWARLLRTRKPDEATTTRALETIERNALSQARLLEDLLNMSRILRGKLELQISQVNLVNIIQAAIETAYPEANNKKIHLEFNCEDSVPSIAGDPNRLQQVLGNLLSNAIKFTPEGGLVEVRLSLEGSGEWGIGQGALGSQRRAGVSPVEATGVIGQGASGMGKKTNNAQCPIPNAQITVSDTGVGISREFLPYIFERYRQANEGNKLTGLGLGLAIARHIIELHSGTIEADSEGEGKGSTFTIRLPLGARG